MSQEYTLEDLASITGLTLRTLRFYMQAGLLQGPDTHGKNARYSQHHVDRLELIQRMKALRLPLQEIRHLLSAMTPEEISQVRHYQDVLGSGFEPALALEEPQAFSPEPEPEPEPEPGAGAGAGALDYIRSLEQGRDSLRMAAGAPRKRPPQPGAPAAAPPGKQIIIRDASARYHETWTRIPLVDGLELHVREPLGPEDQEKLAELTGVARRLFPDRTGK